MSAAGTPMALLCTVSRTGHSATRARKNQPTRSTEQSLWVMEPFMCDFLSMYLVCRRGVLVACRNMQAM